MSRDIIVPKDPVNPGLPKYLQDLLDQQAQAAKRGEKLTFDFRGQVIKTENGYLLQCEGKDVVDDLAAKADTVDLKAAPLTAQDKAVCGQLLGTLDVATKLTGADVAAAIKQAAVKAPRGK